MKTREPITNILVLSLALGSLGIGGAWAQSPQDHGAHHPDAAPVQTAPPPGKTMQPGGKMPGMQGMMGGDMQPMMRMMQAMREQMAGQGMGTPMGMMGMDHIEGRIAFLKAELGISEAQQPQWNAFADVLRAQAGKMQAKHAQMMQGSMPEAFPDRLAMMEHGLSARLEALKAMEEPARALYAVLSPDQQKKGNELLAHPMGAPMGRM
jgi:hypothetical protein